MVAAITIRRTPAMMIIACSLTNNVQSHPEHHYAITMDAGKQPRPRQISMGGILNAYAETPGHPGRCAAM